MSKNRSVSIEKRDAERHIVFDKKDPLYRDILHYLFLRLQSAGRRNERDAVRVAADEPPDVDPGGAR